MNFKLNQTILETGIKKRFIAARAGMAQDRLSRIIHRYSEPSDDEKKALARVLNVPISEIFPTESSSKKGGYKDERKS